jgi:hypothetical protein
VHGLGGDPENTWTYDPNILPKAFAKLSRSAKTPVFWPKDILAPSFGNVRILVYGYDSDPAHMFDSVSRVSVYQHGMNLMQSLADDEGREQDVRLAASNPGPSPKSVPKA